VFLLARPFATEKLFDFGKQVSPLSHSLSHTLAYTRTCTRTQTHAHARTHTHTREHPPPCAGCDGRSPAADPDHARAPPHRPATRDLFPPSQGLVFACLSAGGAFPLIQPSLSCLTSLSLSLSLSLSFSLSLFLSLTHSLSLSLSLKPTQLSGAFLLCTKLRARISCRDMFLSIYDQAFPPPTGSSAPV
jgi:hypothetical protein